MTDSAPPSDQTEQDPRRDRVHAIDVLRGLIIASMVAFHACYDLAYLSGVSMPWFTGTIFQDIWRASISWTFLILAGAMTEFSRNNLKRAALYGACALVVFAATSLAGVDTAVNFGILFCMAASTAICAVARRPLGRISPMIGLTASLVLFAATYHLPLGTYQVQGLAWLGFPSPSFASGDYYPLLPYLSMYLAGMFAQRLYLDSRRSRGLSDYPDWAYSDFCPPLGLLGRHSLAIYLIHQPVLLVLTGCI